MCKPKIRFKDHTEAWEQRKLGDTVEIERGGSPRPIDAFVTNEENGLNWVKIGDAPEQGNYITKTAEKIRREGLKKTRQVFPGDLILSNSMSFGKPYIMGIEGCIHDGWLLIRDNMNRYDLQFLCVLLGSEQMLNQYKAFAAGSTVNNLNKELVGNTIVAVPSRDEQVAIGKCFSKIDNLITLHQRKCEQTKTLKKYMLQKMFPQNGACVPEIRFSGFTDAWEQRKLGEIVVRITRKNQDLVSTLPLTISAQYGLIDQNEFFDKRVASKDVSGYYLINNGEFAYNKSTSSDAPWGAIKRLDRYENGVLSTLYIVFAIKEDVEVASDYLVTYYDTDLWHRGVREIAAEGARNHGLLNIAPADFFETSLAIPQDIEEQKAIGKCFSELNALITLHQRKCEELKNIKKYMLQNMFVQ